MTDTATVVENPIPIAYIGEEDVFVDHMYRTGLEFLRGETTEVPPWAAVLFLKHTDAFEDRRKGFQKGKRIIPRTNRPAPVLSQEEIDNEMFELQGQIPLQSMTIAQMQTFAMQNFGIKLPASLVKEDVANHVRHLVGGRTGMRMR